MTTTTKAKTPDHWPGVFVWELARASLGMVQQGRLGTNHRRHRDRVTVAVPPPPARGILPARGPEVEPAWGGRASYRQ
jgi:hypothetical protein